MGWKAGDKITAARLFRDSDLVLLSNDTAGALNTWEQWGTETISFDNPVVAVHVRAWLIGRMFDNVDATSNPRTRVAISLDGGTSFTTGAEFPTNVGTGAGATARLPQASVHHRSGIPSGSVVIKAELRTDDLSVNFDTGSLMADIFAE